MDRAADCGVQACRTSESLAMMIGEVGIASAVCENAMVLIDG